MSKDSGNVFHHTELGVLPVDWSIRSIKELQLDISDGNYSSKYPRADEFKSVGIPFIRANNIKGLTIIDDDMRFISEAKHSEITKGHLKDGDVLITNRGEIGNLAIVPARHISSNINAQIVRINTSGSEVSNRYFAYYLQKDEVKKLLVDLSSGSALKQLPVNRLTTLKVIIPSLQEQTAIANALSDVDALIQELEKLIAKKQAIKTATMQQLLTGRTRLPPFAHHPDGRKKGYKPSELGEIPEDWAVEPFSKLAKPDNARVNPKVDGGGDFCIELEHISSGTGSLLGSTETNENSSLKSIFASGDVLFGKLRSYLRKYWLAEFSGVCSTEIWVLKPEKNKAISGFIFYLVQRDEFIEAASEAYGTHMPRSDWKVVSMFPVATPSMEEQVAITSILSDLDAEIQAFEKRLSKTRQIKQGMMQELLTGKTRLVKPEIRA